MTHNGSQNLWRYTEQLTSPSNVEGAKVDNEKSNFTGITTGKGSVKMDAIEATKTASSDNLTLVQAAHPKKEGQNVLLLENIRLLKVHMYKPKSFKTDNSRGCIGPTLNLKDKEKLPVTQKDSSCAPYQLSKAKETKFPIVNSKGKSGNSSQPTLEQNFIGPSDRWPSKPKSYRGARKTVIKPQLCVDTTDGETSGMGSSVDEFFESSTESEATASLPPPKTIGCRTFPPPHAKMFQKRRGGWPKGRKRNPISASGLSRNSYPKSPTTAYGYFLIDRHKLYQAIQPNTPIPFLLKILGAEWKQLSEDDKSDYVARSEQDKQRYKNEVKCYRLSRDNQLALRRKRVKVSAMKEKKSIGEESSDCTDEVDDDENGDLYCRTCDQWFTSRHNKREHLYGRYHLQALRDGQPKTWKNKWKSAKSVTFAGEEEPQSEACESPLLVKSESEDDVVSMSTGDELASKSDCQSYMESTTEDEDEIQNEPYFPERVSDCLQTVVSKVYDREQEIKWLTEHLELGKRHQQLLTCSLSSLEKRRKELQAEQELIAATRRILTRELRSLWTLPLSVEGDQDAKSGDTTVPLLEEPNVAPVESTPSTSTSAVEELPSNATDSDSPLFSDANIDHFELEANFDLENFAASLLGEDVDLNLFTSDFFTDLEQNLEGNYGNET